MKQHKGSKGRILDLISSPDFISVLNTLIKDTGATISVSDNWMPKDAHNAKEAELKGFLKDLFNAQLANDITKWWLHKSGRTPNWDLISTCTIDSKKGILLVEAKAHAGELKSECKGKPYDVNTKSEGTKENHKQIAKAIEEANIGISKEFKGITISIDKCYQLSNRIAHAWWLANQGIPVVLMYLGFLNCEDMDYNKKQLFKTPKDWEDCFINHAKLVGTDAIIKKTVNCGKSSFIMICNEF